MIVHEVPEYVPVNDKARQFHASPAKVRMLPGGNQSGKTTTGAADFWMKARDFPTGCQGIALTNTYPDIGKNLWPTHKQFLHPSEYTISWANRAAAIPSIVTLKSNGFKAYYGSYDQGRERHQGVKWDVVQFDEEGPEDIWIEVFRGTLARSARIIYTLTFLKGHTYAVEDILAKCKDPENPNYWTPDEPMSLLENPHVSQAEKDMWIDMLSEKGIQSRVYGYAVSPEGLVFSEFSIATHVCDPFPVPDDWVFYRGIDFGREHPTTSIIMATDGFAAYIVDEYYQPQRLVEEHVHAMNEQHKGIRLASGTNVLPALNTVSDHDAQLRAEYEKLGIYSTPAQKERVAGIEVVQNLLKIRSSGLPRLQVFSHCKNTIREFGLYHYPGKDRKGSLKPGEKADDPVKEFDDCLDAARYILVEAFGFVRDELHKIVSIRKR